MTTELQNSKVHIIQPLSISARAHYFAFSARLAARDAHVRESWVRAMEARIVRDQLQSCYRAEGVNHYETCRELSEKYITLLRENRVGLRFSLLGASCY